MKKVKLGSIVRVVILDHCMRSGEEPLEPKTFEVFGRVVVDKPKFIALATWIDPEGPIDLNTEVFIVVKSAIKEIKVLR
jgi:hypothetical protein